MATNKVEYLLHAPSHSDYLVYWTGKKIMQEHGDLMASQPHYPSVVVEEFLKLLRDILEFGLWLRKHEGADHIKVNGKDYLKPSVARVCFTELKISDSLMHANKFGPLGLGFKRLFVTNRMGSPMYYVPGHGIHPFFPPYSEWYDENNPAEIFSFFKNMSSRRDSLDYIEYDLYEESEWRIIYSENMKKHLSLRKQKYFIDPKLPESGKCHSYYRGITGEEKPDYIIPLDEWLALIIYPNLQIKNAAQRDPAVRNLLAELKRPKEETLAEGIPSAEVINYPAEVDIGAIKNF